MNYLINPKLLIRTPLLSYSDYKLINLGNLLSNPHFHKALYLAKPGFYSILESKNFDKTALNEKELFTLAKYYNRLSFRCTPLGLFASFSLGSWGNESAIKMAGNNAIQLHVRPDHKILYHLSDTLFAIDNLKSSYFLNPCLYRVHQEYRFIKTTVADDNDKLVFAIESLERNVFTSKLIKYCRDNTRTGVDIITFIINKTGCTHDEAAEYLDFLVQSQIILSVNSINITGDGYFKRTLKEGVISATSKKQLEKIDQQFLNNHLSLPQLKSIQHTLKHLTQVENEDRSALYSVSERQVLSGNLDINTQKQITRALHVLKILNGTATVTAPGVKQFIQQFKARYDLQKVPLLHAVDPEIGIGYSNTSRPDDALIPEAAWIKNEESKLLQMPWTDVHKLLMSLWCMGNKQDAFSPIILTDTDIKQLAEPDDGKYPPSLSVMFRKCDNGKILIETAAGVSAISLIGRFSVFNKEVEHLCQHIAEVEQNTNPDVIFAEITQLSNLHVDNVNRRRFIYDYEVPINAVSLKPADKQIDLSDLWLSVVNDELILESEKLNKRIIPRHSSAYNYINNNLGVFRLLCDMQSQGIKANFMFSMEMLFPGLQFYPRLQYEDIILSAAKWNLGAGFIEELKKCTNAHEEITRFNALKEKWQFPQHIALNKADQFLVFNLQNSDEVQFLLSNIKLLKTLRLQEYIPDDSTVFDNDKPIAAQYIALLHNTESVYHYNPPDKESLYHFKRTHIPGSEWLYLKIYCDEAFADRLLSKELLPTLKQLLKEELVSMWFFVRYNDSGYHLRLRMKLNNAANCGNVLRLFNKKLNDIVHYRLIKEYVADSYQPELERYGADMMQLTESLFFASSQLIIQYLSRSGGKRDPLSVYGFAMTTVYRMTDIFIPVLEDKIKFFERMAALFYREFADDKQLRVELDTGYRNIKQQVIQIFNTYNNYKHLQLSNYLKEFLHQTNNLFLALASASQQRRNQMLADVIHMHINRLFTTRQRRQELLTYYFLHKYALYKKAMEKNK